MDIFLMVYGIIMMVLGSYAMLNVIFNLVHFKHLAQVEKKTEGPLISVIIPARNEEENIGPLLDSMMAQDYKNIEILVINDQSTDRTAEILEEYRKKDSRIRVYTTDTENRAHKHGKINALLQLIPHARGEYMLATDADTVHAPDCISHAYSIMSGKGLDIISGFPKEDCASFWGTICISAMMLTYIFIPQYIVRRFPIPAATFAIGQFIMMRSEAYRETGGYEKIQGAICDDIGIVRLFVRHKKKYAFVSLTRHSECKMYKNFQDSFNGIERSIAGVIPAKAAMILPVAIIIVALMLIAFSIPFAIAALAVFKAGAATVMLLAGSLLFAAAWFICFVTTGWKKRIAISAPLTLIMTAAMYLHGLFRELTGKGFVWKGRIVI